MKFSEESSDGQQYEKKETLGNFKEADGRKYISRGFLPLIGKHMYQLAALSVDSKIIRKYQWTWTSFSLEITTSQSQAYSSFFSSASSSFWNYCKVMVIWWYYTNIFRLHTVLSFSAIAFGSFSRQNISINLTCRPAGDCSVTINRI